MNTLGVLYMWPFNKPKKSTQTSNLPEEVQRYYDAEERDRNGTTWLLAAGTLVATVVIAVGLFFGGRWLIMTIFGDDDTATNGTTTSQTSSTSTSEADPSNNATQGTNDETEAPDTLPATDVPTSTTDEEVRSSQTPSTGNASDLPNTGPSGPLL